MKAILHRINGVEIDLNGEIMANVAHKIGSDPYIEKRGRTLVFTHFMAGKRIDRLHANTTGEMYAYLCGILNF